MAGMGNHVNRASTTITHTLRFLNKSKVHHTSDISGKVRGCGSEVYGLCVVKNCS